MPSPAYDLATVVANAGIGTLAGASDWGIYVHTMPASPERCIMFADVGGQPPHPSIRLDFPVVRVVVRGRQNDFPDAWNKMKEIRDKLLGLPKTTVNGNVYAGVWVSRDVESLEDDEKERVYFTMFLRCAVEPSTTSYSNRT